MVRWRDVWLLLAEHLSSSWQPESPYWVFSTWLVSTFLYASDAELCNYLCSISFVLLLFVAFPLKIWLLRPIPGRSLDSLPKKVYNYRLSRARRTVEVKNVLAQINFLIWRAYVYLNVLNFQNAFGIMVFRWRCLWTTLLMQPDNATSVILACSVLHNYMRQQHCANYCPPGFADTVGVNGGIFRGLWWADGDVLGAMNPTAQRNPQPSATAVRETFINYLSKEGALQW